MNTLKKYEGQREINRNEDIDWNKVPENTEVIVWNDPNECYIGYFCMKEDGLYYVFDNDGSSYSEDFLDVTYNFEHCQLAKRKDAKKYMKRHRRKYC